MGSWQKPTDEMIEKAMMSVKKETDRQYFFSRLKNPLWIKPLDERGCFGSPPDIINVEDREGNFIQHPSWPELQYLKNMVSYCPREIVDIILRFPVTKNQSVYADILDIALQMPGDQSEKLADKILEYADTERHLSLYRYPNILKYWVQENRIDVALELTKKLVAFVEDPQAEQKKKLYKKDPDDPRCVLEAIPRFGTWEYQEILKKGVHPLATKAPWKLASILIEAVSEMNSLNSHSAEIHHKMREDYSEVWCRRLEKSEERYESSKQTLVHILTYACEVLYQKAPEHIPKLNEKLLNQPWLLFKRLRQHLYARNLNEKTKSWVRELILNHPDYAEWNYRYEFQQMLRCACEHFGEKLLTKKERTAIFDAIQSGPSKATYRAWLGDNFTDNVFDNVFRQRQQKFHRMQLKPFLSVLFGKYSAYFQQLESELNESITDEDYSPVGKIEIKTMSYRSPKSPENLATLGDEGLLAYINNWQGKHDPARDWMEEVNIHALSMAFQKTFIETIIPDENRLEFWLSNRNRIQRPAYVRAMVDAMQENVKTEKSRYISRWLDFCLWVLSHPDEIMKDSRYGDESREHPNWTTSRQSVGKFIETCLDENANIPISARSELAALLQKLCTQPDWMLDNEDLAVSINPVNTAINTTRGLALESLVSFGFWVRWHDSSSDVSEIAAILDSRFSQKHERPITLPEYAVLGQRYCYIAILDQTWAQDHKGYIFPHNDLSKWRAAFNTVVKYGPVREEIYKNLKGEFEFALDNLAEFAPNKQNRKEHRNELIDRLGQHLFFYYLWGLFPLKGNESLLEIFYKKTQDAPNHWNNLFHHVGRLLGDAGKDVEEDLATRFKDFFEWRISERNTEEFQGPLEWLHAQCMSVEWRLASLSQILDICEPGVRGLMRGVPELAEMLEEHPKKVVECFKKMTALLPVDNYLYIDTDEAKKILKFGLNSDDQNALQHAKDAREKLLSHGHFDFLQLDE